MRSAAVADGYFPDLDESKLGNGLFIPDDLLVRQRSGFKIAGRISDVINVAGKKVNPAEMEAHLLSLPGVRQAVVFGRHSALRNEEVAACVVSDANIGEAELLQSCRMRLSGWQVPKRIFFVPEIPVNERGKTSRRELADALCRQIGRSERTTSPIISDSGTPLATACSIKSFAFAREAGLRREQSAAGEPWPLGGLWNRSYGCAKLK